MRRPAWSVLGLIALSVAVLAHLGGVIYAPRLAMFAFMKIVAPDGSLGPTITHYERATAKFRTFPAASPDLFYSICTFDLNAGRLKVTTAAPQNTYWSASFFAANSDNFFVVNDQSADGRPATIIVDSADSTLAIDREATIIRSPTSRGIVIFRTLINDDAREAELDRERRKATCELMQP